jgi:hypothetical protein
MSDPAVRPGAADPAPPQLAIVVYADGRASVGGVPVVVPDAGDLAAVRAAVMRTAIGMAARQGRPLRALAFEPDGETWPLLIHPDGTVEEDTEAEASAGGADGTSAGASTLSLLASPAPPRGPRTETIVLNPQWSDVVQTPQPPERFRDRLARIAEAGEGGRIEAAMTLAADLEREAGLLFGATHPHVLQARAVRAHISTLAHDWGRAAEVYLDITAAWLEVSGDRSAQVRENAGNAHYCWVRVADPQEGERIGEAVVRTWLKVPGARRELEAARRRRDDLGRRSSLGL